MTDQPTLHGEGMAIRVGDNTFSVTPVGPQKEEPLLLGQGPAVLSDERSPDQFHDETIKGPLDALLDATYSGRSPAIHVFGTDVATRTPPPPVSACDCNCVQDTFSRFLAGGWGMTEGTEPHAWAISGLNAGTDVDGAHGVIRLFDADSAGGIVAGVVDFGPTPPVSMLASIDCDSPGGVAGFDATLQARFSQGTGFADKVYASLGIVHGAIDPLEVYYGDDGYGAVILPGIDPENKFWVRIHIDGSVFQIRLWQDGDAEPSTWDLEVSKGTTNTGFGGFAWVASSYPSNNNIQIDDFKLCTDGGIVDTVTICDYGEATWTEDSPNVQDVTTNPTYSDYGSPVITTSNAGGVLGVSKSTGALIQDNPPTGSLGGDAGLETLGLLHSSIFPSGSGAGGGVINVGSIQLSYQFGGSMSETELAHSVGVCYARLKVGIADGGAPNATSNITVSVYHGDTGGETSPLFGTTYGWTDPDKDHVVIEPSEGSTAVISVDRTTAGSIIISWAAGEWHVSAAGAGGTYGNDVTVSPIEVAVIERTVAADAFPIINLPPLTPVVSTLSATITGPLLTTQPGASVDGCPSAGVSSDCTACEDASNPGVAIPPFTPGYLPIFRRQIGDPTTTLDSFICTFESCAMLLDWHTRGAVQVWGGELIPYSGRTPASIIASGSNLGDSQQAWLHWSQHLSIRTGGTWNDVMACLAEGRAVALQGDYGVFTLAERCQDDFVDNHCVAVLPYQQSDRLLTGDPICKTWHGRKISSLQNYAEAFGSPSFIYFAVTRPWTP